MNRLIPIAVLLSASTCEAAGQPGETAIWVDGASWCVRICAPPDRVCPVMPELTWANGFAQVLVAALTPH